MIKDNFKGKEEKVVRSDLIPGVPKRIEFTFHDLRWFMFLDPKLNSRVALRNMPEDTAVLSADSFKIRFKTKRVGKYLKPKRYIFSFMMNLTKIQAHTVN